MARRRLKKDNIARAAMDVGMGGIVFGIGTDIVGRVPHAGPGAAAMATGAGLLPVYGVTRIGGVVIGEARKLGKKQKKQRSWLF